MCGRMYMEPEDPTGELNAIIATLKNRMGTEANAVKFFGEIFPSDTIPVITTNEKHERNVLPMKWGFPKFDGKGLIINARSETAAIKPMFKESAKSRRCIIPASHYFEWEKRENQKVKYAIRPAHGSLSYIAGLYKTDVKASQILFTVLTRQADEKISFIHDRMPVIMPKDMISDWLSPGYNFDELLREADRDMQYWAV